MKIVPLFLKAERSAGGLGLNEQQIGLYYGTYGGGSLCAGVTVGRLLHFAPGIAADAVLSVLHLQSAFCGVYPACHVPAGKRVADR